MSVSLYQQVASEFLAKVDRGAIKVGERLPPEEVYAQHLGISRSTLRLAFSQLEKNGIIKRRKRGGTEVVSNKPIKKYSVAGGNLFDFLTECDKSEILITDIRHQSTDGISELAHYNKLVPNWTTYTGQRFKAGEATAFTYSHIHVPECYSDIDIKVGDRVSSVFAIVERRYGVSTYTVKQALAAELCPEEVAFSLGVQEGSPIIAVTLEMQDINGNILTAARNYFDSSRINLKSETTLGELSKTA